jgi:hypothetical protein
MKMNRLRWGGGFDFFCSHIKIKAKRKIIVMLEGLKVRVLSNLKMRDLEGDQRRGDFF